MSEPVDSKRLFIRFFDETGPAPIELLGGKCASLVALTTAGMPVPPGFAITTDAYTAFIESSGIADDIHALLNSIDPDDVESIDAVSAQIRDEILKRPVPAAIHDEFSDAYAELQSRFADETPVAVRSSATAEDLPDASFAGQQDTYLWLVGRDEVAEHVRRCWASLYTSRAIVYRLRAGIPNEGLSMAVAVQKMVDAEDRRRRDDRGPVQRRPLDDRDRRRVGPGRTGRLGARHARQPARRQGDADDLRRAPRRQAHRARAGCRCQGHPRTRGRARAAQHPLAHRRRGHARSRRWPSAPRSTSAARRTSSGRSTGACPRGRTSCSCSHGPRPSGPRSPTRSAPTTSGFGIASITQSLMAQIGR